MVALIIGPAFGMKYYSNKYNEALVKVQSLEVTNATLSNQIKLIQEAKQINDDIITDQKEEIESLVAKNKEYKAKADKEIKKILEKFSELPDTKENQDQQAQEISTVRINQLWQSYCSTQRNSHLCKNNDPVGASK